MTTIEQLKQSLEHMFDFTEAYEFGGTLYPLYGRYFRRNSKYFAVKKAELYAFSNFEHMFYYRKSDGIFTRAEFRNMVDSAKSELEQLIKPNDEHMSTVVTFIIECDGIEDGLSDEVKSYKYRKTFKWGLFGWVDFKVALIVRAADGSFAVENKLAQGDAKKLGLI